MDKADASEALNYGTPPTQQEDQWYCWECKLLIRERHPEDHALECPQHVSLGQQEYWAQKAWDEWVSDSVPKGGYI